jgi:DNA-binding SARP family transcriptional activator
LILFVSEVRVIGVRVLGPLQVMVDDVPADVGGPRQRCVLARLIAEHGRVVSADRLIEDLYADEAPPQALATVQSYVSHLRRALEPGRPARAPSGVLVTSPPGYAIRLGQDAVDAWSFEDEIQQAAELDDPVAVHNRLSSALTSWRGPAFQEFGGMTWADLEASRLEELRLMATERLANAALGLGRAAQAVAGLDRLTAEYPLREEAWRLLALALYQSGRQGDALSALRRARARLAADLGVDPGPALRELESDILAQAPHLNVPPAAPSRTSVAAVPAPVASNAAPATAPPQAGAAPQAGARPQAGAAPQAGAEAELSQVAWSAREAAAGRMRIVLVSGNAGAGKTALADRVSQHLISEGWTVAAWRCPEGEGARPGWPWAEALRRLTVTTPAEPQSLAAPLLLVLDDLHRADGETLSLLADVTADLAGARILVLATYRPAEASTQLSGYLAALGPREPVRVDLAGPDAVPAGALIQATRTGPVAEQTEPAIAERAIAERTGVPGTPGTKRRGIRRGRHGQTRQPEPNWVPTAERFRDPPTGVIMRVWIDPSDESRHYVPDDA